MRKTLSSRRISSAIASRNASLTESGLNAPEYELETNVSAGFEAGAEGCGVGLGVSDTDF